MGRPKTRKMWSEEEEKYVAENYSNMKQQEIADVLGRTKHAIREKAKLLGIVPKRQDLSLLPAFIKKHHSYGWNDLEIANAWEARTGNSIRKETVLVRRRKLGLNAVGRTERTSQRCRNTMIAKYGRPHHKKYAEREFVISRGWPEFMSARCVLILDTIYDAGPLTKQQLCQIFNVETFGTRYGIEIFKFLVDRGFLVLIDPFYAIPLTIERHKEETWPVLEKASHSTKQKLQHHNCLKK